MAAASALSWSRTLRESAGSLSIKSLNRFDNLGPLKVSLSPKVDGQCGTHTAVRRSAYSVLRMRNAPPGACAQNLLSCAESSLQENICRCCCSALLYRSPIPHTSTLSLAPEEERVRDDFVFSLKLAEIEQPLRGVIGDSAYTALVGPSLAQSRWVGLCHNLPEVYEGDGRWVARVLLTQEEEHRIKWLREDGAESLDMYSRLTSFKTMHAAFHSMGEEKLGLCQFEAIERRMREGGVKWDMCDAAVACFFGAKREELRPFCCHVVRDILLEAGVERVGVAVEGSYETSLRRILGAMLLLHILGVLTLEVKSSCDKAFDPPLYLLETAKELFALAKFLPSDEFGGPLRIITARCRESVLALVSFFTVPVSSPYLSDFTLWLLREAPDVATCHRHFRQMTLRSHVEAIALLEKSCLLSPQCLDLRSVVEVLLPLLDFSEVEDFYVVVFTEVLARLEERLRRNVESFTEDDFRLLTALGVRLFEGQGGSVFHAPSHPGGECPFDARKLEQLEQLQVMGGSPWSFIRLSCDYLKEVVRALLRDGSRSRDTHHSGAQDKTKLVLASRLLNTNEGEVKNDALVPEAPENVAYTVPHTSATAAAASGPFARSTDTIRGVCGLSAGVRSRNAPLTPPLSSTASLRDRFIIFIEELVKALVERRSSQLNNSSVVSNDLFSFVSKYMPLPNIHDEYRRKIYLLVNVMSEESSRVGGGGGADPGDDVPRELRYLVMSLSLMLSPWAAVMILREVLRESSGMNPRYTYVLNSAIDLQLPTSTTRSRMATTLNMWRFISSQSAKMTFAEQLSMKRRCAVNIPLSYILSSYWSLLTWLTLLALIGLNIAGLDLEAQYVAACLFNEFSPPDDVIAPTTDEHCAGEVQNAISAYFEDCKLVRDNTSPEGSCVEGETMGHGPRDGLFPLASYVSSQGLVDQQRPMTVISVGSKGDGPVQGCIAKEFGCASLVLRELSARTSFPFYLPIEKLLSTDLIIGRAAERIRRVSFNNAWSVSRAVFRTFPLGRSHTEYGLVSHTCTQANSKRRRITFLLYFQRSVPIPPQLLVWLSESVLAQHGNLVLVVHEDSLITGGTTLEAVTQLSASNNIRYIRCSATAVGDAHVSGDLHEPRNMFGMMGLHAVKVLRVVGRTFAFAVGGPPPVSHSLHGAESVL
uniref:Uncharacterized protein TCIL3000_3_2250 n=1 Tax=Trypanosoma congolense (strain IL3000) TaxID=1068625 RepID=G0UK88_TRYCI|nr:unnamed protein product [Trypanosoma congolense IL3000]